VLVRKEKDKAILRNVNAADLALFKVRHLETRALWVGVPGRALTSQLRSTIKLIQGEHVRCRSSPQSNPEDGRVGRMEFLFRGPRYWRGKRSQRWAYHCVSCVMWFARILPIMQL
jgi:hypothetical protein